MHFPSHYKNPAKKDQIMQVRRRPAGHVDTTLRTLTPSPTSESSTPPSLEDHHLRRGSFRNSEAFSPSQYKRRLSASDSGVFYIVSPYIFRCVNMQWIWLWVMRNTNESKLGCHDVIMLKLKSVTFWLSVTDWLRLARYWVVFALEMKIILVNFEFQKVCGD